MADGIQILSSKNDYTTLDEFLLFPIDISFIYMVYSFSDYKIVAMRKL